MKTRRIARETRKGQPASHWSMLARLSTALILILLGVLGFWQIRQRPKRMGAAAALPVIPAPAQVRRDPGVFRLTARTIVDADEASRPSAAIVSAWLTRLKSDDREGRARGRIVLRVDRWAASHDEEGYALTIARDRVELRATTAAGIFYGIQTLRQLLPPEIESAQPMSSTVWELPRVRIVDRPRFRWRGMHLDVSRHFFTVPEVKRYLDLLALFKFNRFHWHLTDDGGWRLPSRAYPRLNQVGSWRRPMRKGWDVEALDFAPPRPGEADSGGFYSADEIRDIVAYAAARHIQVVPEIDLPAHCIPAIAAYPELACTPDRGSEPIRRRNNVLCLGNPVTRRFIDSVLSETCDLFPGEFVHIGCDEVDLRRWERCATCRRRMQDEGMTAPQQLRSDFLRRAALLLKSRGRRMIAWDDALDGDPTAAAVSMAWRSHGASDGSERPIIMAPNSTCYFQLTHDELPTAAVQAFDPAPESLTPRESARVLGAEGCVWTEFIADWTAVERAALPRMMALAEAVWSPRDLIAKAGFASRLDEFYQRLDAMHVSYYFPPPVPSFALAAFSRSVTLSFTPPATPGVGLYLGGGAHEPTARSFRYVGPLQLERDTTLTAVFVGPGGSMGATTRVTAFHLPPVDDRGLRPSLTWQFYPGPFQHMPELGKIAPDSTGDMWMVTMDTPLIASFAIRWSGLLKIAEEGVYTFTLGSDDGGSLRLHGFLLVDDEGPHAYRERTGRAFLSPGLHPIAIDYFNAFYNGKLRVFIEGPSVPRQELQLATMWHAGPGRSRAGVGPH